MKKETSLMRQVQLALGKRGDIRTFRNNVGMLIDLYGNRVRYGLCPGSSDLIGLQSVTITPDMVGRKLAVFVAIETKSAKGRARDNQTRFLDMVNEMGGRAGYARSVEEAAEIVGENHDD